MQTSMVPIQSSKSLNRNTDVAGDIKKSYSKTCVCFELLYELQNKNKRISTAENTHRWFFWYDTCRPANSPNIVCETVCSRSYQYSQSIWSLMDPGAGFAATNPCFSAQCVNCVCVFTFFLIINGTTIVFPGFADDKNGSNNFVLCVWLVLNLFGQENGRS